MWFIGKYIFIVLSLLFAFLVTGQSSDGEKIDDTLQGDIQYQRPEDVKREKRLQLEEQQRQIERENELLQAPVDQMEKQEMEETEKRENFYSL